MTQYIPQCMRCKHFNAADRLRETCTAFPDGIPEEILENRVWHNKPVEGDHGVQFDPVDDDAAVWFVKLTTLARP